MAETPDIPPRERRELLRPKDITQGRARKLRRQMSLPEVLLWNELKANKVGFSFRRQTALGPWVADFYCHEALLVVEIDGSFHYNQNEYDRDRDQWMIDRAVDVMRIDAKFVLESPARVAGAVRVRCQKRVEVLGERRAPGPHATPGLEDSATPSACAEGDL
jgi:very-short-patch-repair endonuclease